MLKTFTVIPSNTPGEAGTPIKAERSLIAAGEFFASHPDCDTVTVVYPLRFYAETIQRWMVD